MKIQIILTQGGTIVSDDVCSFKAGSEMMLEVMKGLLPIGLSEKAFFEQLQVNMDSALKELMGGEGVQLVNPATNSAFTFQIKQPKRERTLQ